MRQVPLSVLENKIVRPGIEAHLKPLIMYRGRVTLGDAHRMWNLILSGMEHEATIPDLTQRVQKNAAYSQLCCPNAVKPSVSICSFLSRLEDNPHVMAEVPGLAEYVDWLGGWRFSLTPVAEVSHNSRNIGAGGWRTFIDRRVKPIPAGFTKHAARMTTTELVQHYGVSFPTISNWRRKAGITAPPRHWSRRPADLVYPFLIHDGGKPEHSLLRKVNGAVPRGLDPSLRADMCQDLIVGILAGDLSEDDLGLPSRELTKRIWQSSPARYGERSLEAVIGDDDFTLLDTLADEGRDWV